MMRVYILLAVAVVVLVFVAMCQFQDENRRHTSNAPSDKLAPKMDALIMHWCPKLSTSTSNSQ
jgi:hypothetical protein